MNDQATSPIPKFGIGQSAHRKEDQRLLEGGGRYTDDSRFDGELHAAFVRSDHAHGRIQRLDVAAARAMPGVHLVLTAADLDGEGYQDLPCSIPVTGAHGEPLIVPPHPSLARDRVRYVGQPIALVVAETPAAGRDAADAIEVEIDSLPAVADPEAALAPDAPELHAEAPNNMPLHWRYGDPDAVDAAFARAAHVTRLRIVNNRVVVAPMEPRGAIASFESGPDAGQGRYVLRTGCQGAFGLRGQLAQVLACEPERVRVLAEDIGGSFGMKASVFPEHVPILHAARQLGRPVKWINDRRESFLADYHGRDSVFTAALALDAEGRFLAVRLDGVGDLGAYVVGAGPLIPTMSIQKNTPSVYRLPSLGIDVRLALTNTTPTTAYRGAGRPEAIYMMERLIDTAAHETGRDRIALRRLNLLRPDELPYEAASGLTYDSGEFEAVMDKALERADWAGFEARRRQSVARGRLRGIGLTTYLEVTAPVGREMGGIRFEPDGRVTIVTGTLDYGQGHRSPFAQVLADRLGVPFEAIDLVQGDSDQLLFGGGTGGSRSIMASGTAIIEASEAVIERGRKLAGHILEAAAADISFEAGRFRIAGTDRSIGLMELAREVRENGDSLPEELPRSLDVGQVSETPPSAFPNGCHIAEVEIDPETGRTEILRYVAVDDFGTMVNPLLVEGQVHGGLVQAIGQALGEEAVYDGDGQLLAGSFMDYVMPRADDLPAFELDFHPVPCRTNPLGAKGCGEAGITAGLSTVMNAIIDALSPHGVRHLDMPATAERVWRAIQEAKVPAAAE